MLGFFSIWALAITYGHTQSTRVARGASFCQASKLKTPSVFDAGVFFYLGKMSRWQQIVIELHRCVDTSASVQCENKN